MARPGLDVVVGVCHGHGMAHGLEHLEVVVGVAEGHDLVLVDGHEDLQHAHRGGLGPAVRHDVKHAAARREQVELGAGLADLLAPLLVVDHLGALLKVEACRHDGPVRDILRLHELACAAAAPGSAQKARQRGAGDKAAALAAARDIDAGQVVDHLSHLDHGVAVDAGLVHEGAVDKDALAIGEQRRLDAVGVAAEGDDHRVVVAARRRAKQGALVQQLVDALDGTLAGRDLVGNEGVVHIGKDEFDHDALPSVVGMESIPS